MSVSISFTRVARPAISFEMFIAAPDEALTPLPSSPGETLVPFSFILLFKAPSLGYGRLHDLPRGQRELPYILDDAFHGS